MTNGTRLDWSELPYCIQWLEAVSFTDSEEKRLQTRTIAFLEYMHEAKSKQRHYHKQANARKKLVEQKLKASLSQEELDLIDQQAEEHIDGVEGGS